MNAFLSLIDEITLLYGKQVVVPPKAIKAAIEGKKKFKKALVIIGSDAEEDAIKESLTKLWEANSKAFDKLDSWSEYSVVLQLYRKDQLVKGPKIDVTAFYEMAKIVDDLNSKMVKVSTKEEVPLKTKLQEALFSLLTPFDPRFKPTKVVSPMSPLGGEINLAQLTGMMNNIAASLDSGKGGEAAQAVEGVKKVMNNSKAQDILGQVLEKAQNAKSFDEILGGLKDVLDGGKVAELVKDLENSE